MSDQEQLRQLKNLIKELTERLNRQGDRIKTLETSAANQATNIAAINAKTQAVNQTIALAANIPLDVTIPWPQAWPDTAYNIVPVLTTGNAVLGGIHATPKSGSKTVNDCVVTVLATTAIASAGLYVLGERT